MVSATSEVWGYSFFTATRMGMGSRWIGFVILGPLPRSTIPPFDPFDAIPPAILFALEAYGSCRA